MGRPIRNLTGQRFGKLVVIGFRGMFGRPRKRPAWTCKCDCGRKHIVRSGPLLAGETTSCGCAREAKNRSRSKLVAYDGVTKHVSQWEKAYGLGKGRLSQRLAAGWPLEKALTEPLQPRKRGTNRTP